VTPLLSLADVRDIVIIAAGSLFILLLIAAFAVMVVVVFGAKGLFGSAQTLIKDEVTPMAREGKLAAKRAQGTVTFISENAVTPVIRVSAAMAGARRMLSVLAGLSSRRNK
jgi:hypothetical protein